jgi:hypothetical protein
MGAELTLDVDNPHPLEKSAMAAAGADGSFTGATYSFLLVAWYSSGESDNDRAGWLLTVPTEWENLVVAADNHVTIDWNTPLDANGEKRYPDHYTVYAQVDSSYTLGSAGTTCWTNAGGTSTEFDGTATSGTLYDEGSVNKTMDAAYSQVVLNPILNLKPLIRRQTVRGFDGRLVQKSYAHVNPVQSLSILLVSNSCTNLKFKKLLKCILYSIPIKITESLPGAAEDNPYVRYWYGRITDSPEYLGTKKKNTSAIIPIEFEVETATLA